jgi:hypothetical protein
MDLSGVGAAFAPGDLGHLVLILHLVVLGVFMFLAWILSRERQRLGRELIAVVKKIDGLTSDRREQILRHYDGILGELAAEMPERIVRETGHRIFEAESRILTRLAELEPDLKNDPVSREKMNELIEVMEYLETAVAEIAATTVRDALGEARQTVGHRIFEIGQTVPPPAER